ncbi:MAG: helix-turn-helix transcriptional regulator [Candidatus Eremiobacteraeota bacterium]|nr:helix-turn-helix transcriptional regulator [Candidatus Eremiobacteraeota bacterium]
MQELPTFGERLRAIRQQRGVPQGKLAARLGISAGHLSRIEPASRRHVLSCYAACLLTI